jgi:hypothetical protein
LDRQIAPIFFALLFGIVKYYSYLYIVTKKTTIMSKTITLSDNNTISINQDGDCNPRDWDNLGTMVCFHNRYVLGDDHDYNHLDYDDWDEMESAIIKNVDVAIILPLYLYDHGGITMNTTGFNCRWDSGQVGFVFISKAKLRYEYSVKRISKKLLDRVTGYLVNEIEEYDKHLTGDVYYFMLENEDGETLDTCGGFFGSDIATNGMLDNLPEKYHEELREETTY